MCKIIKLHLIQYKLFEIYFRLFLFSYNLGCDLTEAYVNLSNEVKHSKVI